MPFPVVPKPVETAVHFIQALKNSERLDCPYTRWVLTNTLPEDLCVGILILLIKPPDITDCGGVRDLEENNRRRTFLIPKLQEDLPMVKALVEAFQHPDVARQFSETSNIAPEGLEGSYFTHRVYAGYRRSVDRRS